MDLSLDDIIKQKGRKSGPQRPRGRLNNLDGRNRPNTLGRRNGRPLQNSNERIKKPTQRQTGMVDARMKIIQKNRMRVKDAREKLNDIAKLSDARTKIKGRNLTGAANPRRDRVRGGGGRISHRSNGNVPPAILQRSIRNNRAGDRMTEMRAAGNDLIRCTINRPILDYSEEPSNFLMMNEMHMPLAARPRDDLSNIKIVAQNDYLPYRQEYSPPREPTYMDYEQPTYDRPYGSSSVLRGPLTLARSGARMSMEMRARLDSPVKPTSMFSWTHQPSRPVVVSPPPSPAPSPGYRIVVSNLHQTVTHEDIKELFEDIGLLLDSRLVRPGTAEVIYKMQKDAKKAVEAYHNRQLDGQPMKCLLVNARSPPTSGSSGVLRSNNMPAAPKFPSSSKSTVVPDLSAIHKALFMSK